MTNNEFIQGKLTFRREALTSAREAYLALLNGQVKSYAIGSRNLTRLDLPALSDEITRLEKEIAELESHMNGGGRRKAVGVLIRDW